jgi:hypothetical protein
MTFGLSERTYLKFGISHRIKHGQVPGALPQIEKHGTGITRHP